MWKGSGACWGTGGEQWRSWALSSDVPAHEVPLFVACAHHHFLLGLCGNWWVSQEGRTSLSNDNQDLKTRQVPVTANLKHRAGGGRGQSVSDSRSSLFLLAISRCVYTWVTPVSLFLPSYFGIVFFYVSFTKNTFFSHSDSCSVCVLPSKWPCLCACAEL